MPSLRGQRLGVVARVIVTLLLGNEAEYDLSESTTAVGATAANEAKVLKHGALRAIE